MKKIAFLIDPIEKLKPSKDTSLHLMRGAFLNQHEVYAFEKQTMDLVHDKAYASLYRVEHTQDNFTRTKEHYRPLSDMDEIWVRIDPPVDRSYFYVSLILDYVGTTTQVINSPSALRDWNEKLSALYFPDSTANTLVSQKLESIKKFIDENNKVTLKPIDGFGGKGILFTDPKDPLLEEKILKITVNQSHKIVVQKYIEEAKQGDLRVLIWKSEVLGGILRVHAEGQELNNLDAGGKAVKAELSAKQKQISQDVATRLLKEKIYFAGIDFLGDTLTEINLTSPTGLKELCDFSGVDWHKKIMQ